MNLRKLAMMSVGSQHGVRARAAAASGVSKQGTWWRWGVLIVLLPALVGGVIGWQMHRHALATSEAALQAWRGFRAAIL
jgi:hypothetical protein